jgi:hypothetical protein
MNQGVYKSDSDALVTYAHLTISHILQPIVSNIT